MQEKDEVRPWTKHGQGELYDLFGNLEYRGSFVEDRRSGFGVSYRL